MSFEQILEKIKTILKPVFDYAELMAQKLGVDLVIFYIGVAISFVFCIYLLGLLFKKKEKVVHDIEEESVSEVPLPIMESAKQTGKKKSKKATLTKQQQKPETFTKEEILDKKKHILVVDDSNLILKKLGEELSKYYRVSLASNGFVALDMIDKDTPDLVLSDIEMPNNEAGESCSGFDLLTTLQHSVKYSTIPVILMTANIEIAADKGFELGASGFLSKPFENEIMLSQIDFCLNG